MYNVIRYSAKAWFVEGPAPPPPEPPTPMIVSFKDEGARDIWQGKDTRAARKTCPDTLWSAAIGKLNLLNRAEDVEDLRVPPGNRLEVLRGNRRGQHSIRINHQYRICFRWTDRGPAEVEIVDYH
jgi:toxin HigB-1